MLAILETYLQELNAARTEAEITKILAAAAKAFGFRSAYLIQYAGKLASAQRLLDTDPARRAWWDEYFAGDLRPSPSDVNTILSGAEIKRYNGSRFPAGSDELRAVLEAHDVVDITYVPISHEGELVGVVGFCGDPPLDRRQEMAIQLIAYNAFARLRLSRDAQPGGSIALTPREKEVMRLSADGLTSNEIAEQLGMSARTANQHIDNVADKLGTRNRAHTVAEIVRRGLL
jgi:DNA-binding CsgD family transcriptional regulator